MATLLAYTTIGMLTEDREYGAQYFLVAAFVVISLILFKAGINRHNKRQNLDSILRYQRFQ